MALPVTVVIPAHNAAGTLRRCLDSVLGQTAPAQAVIVVDDGSGDETPAVAAAYGARIRYLRRPQGGPAAARNLGIAQATTEWIAFLDADDEWFPDKLRHQFEYLARFKQAEWAGGNYRIRDYRRGLVYEAMSGAGAYDGLVPDAAQALAAHTLVWTGVAVVRRALLEAVGGFDETLLGPEDLDLWARLAAVSPALVYCAEPLVLYHDAASGSLTSGWSARTDDSIVRLIEKQARLTAALPEPLRGHVRRFVGRHVVNTLTRAVGAGSAPRCRAMLDALDAHRLAPVPLWLRLCCALPSPVAAGLRQAFFKGRRLSRMALR